MDAEAKREYRDLLKRNREQEFQSEFIRTTNLERELVDKYGFAALLLIFEGHNSENYYQLGEFPTESPWDDLNDKSVEEAIDSVFAPIADQIPRLLAALKERCRFLYTEESADGWKLHYFLDITLYDDRSYYHIFIGGARNPRPEVNQNLATYEWDIPADLRRLYSVHDGFGPILSSHEIRVMAEMMDPICEQQKLYPDSYQFRDLLEFHPDGSGNCQCFHLRGARLITVDWDHETWEISGEEEFFDYLDDRLSVLDEE